MSTMGGTFAAVRGTTGRCEGAENDHSHTVVRSVAFAGGRPRQSMVEKDNDKTDVDAHVLVQHPASRPPSARCPPARSPPKSSSKECVLRPS